MKKILIVGLVAILFGCSTKKIKVVIGGSTSVYPLMEKIVEHYEAFEIEVQGGGSTVGVSQTENGVFDIGMLSREVKQSEKEKLQFKEIAKDAIVVVVNHKNPVQNISVENLRKIYKGEITNWQDVGGENKPIVVISRENGSGTKSAFEDSVQLKSRDITQYAQIQNATGAIELSVSSNENAIGYLSFSTLKDNVKALSINDVYPSLEEIKNENYSLVRSYFIVWKNDISKTIVEYLLSKQADEIIKKNNYIGVNNEKR